MKTMLLTNEYPPNIYGGAGVHVEYLSRELSALMDVDVRCFGEQELRDGALNATGVLPDLDSYGGPDKLKSVLGALSRCLRFNTMGCDADVVHCHTWYSHFGGIVAKLCYGIPLVVTVHSLEPLRPWKREQLGGGYDFTLWLEKTALEMADRVIAVSQGTKDDVLKHFTIDPDRISIIYNGIDTTEFRQREASETVERFGIDIKQPYLLFVGRITRQKGILYLVKAIKHMNPDYQVVLCAGAPDTVEIAEEMKSLVAEVSRDREGIFWIDEMVDKRTLIQLYSHARVFCCPSIYEPFGIINLEAMACHTPVVASNVGGIPEVVVHGETGYLVPLANLHEAPFTPYDPDAFARDLAHPINTLMADPALCEKYGRAGRRRAEAKFSWSSIANQTKALYERVVIESKS